jgi:predicted alpha/beta-hydrolase family hydrolase
VSNDTSEPRTLTVSADTRVSALWLEPAPVRACLVLAHGAGAGMRHRSMQDLAVELAARGVATLRYQFPYMERGSRRTDPPPLCHATVRAAVAEAARLAPQVPLAAGGRSFGGRMTSQAQAVDPLPGVRGIAFVAFPLHPAGQPGETRAAHLFDTHVPLLFLQGTRDALAELELLEPLVRRLGARASLELFPDADHSFHVRASSGRRDADVLAAVADALASWLLALARTLPAH